MKTTDLIDLGNLPEKLDKFSIALTLANISDPKQPLIYMNSAFEKLTGYGGEMIGQNCRFLQGEEDNEQARAEIRLAIEERRRTQVVLKNVRANGEVFYNMLILLPNGEYEGLPDMMLGTQIDIGDHAPGSESDIDSDYPRDSAAAARHRSFQLQVERRRVTAEAALRLTQSWCALRAHH